MRALAYAVSLAVVAGASHAYALGVCTPTNRGTLDCRAAVGPLPTRIEGNTSITEINGDCSRVAVGIFDGNPTIYIACRAANGLWYRCDPNGIWTKDCEGASK